MPFCTLYMSKEAWCMQSHCLTTFYAFRLNSNITQIQVYAWKIQHLGGKSISAAVYNGTINVLYMSRQNFTAPWAVTSTVHQVSGCRMMTDPFKLRQVKAAAAFYLLLLSAWSTWVPMVFKMPVFLQADITMHGGAGSIPAPQRLESIRLPWVTLSNQHHFIWLVSEERRGLQCASSAPKQIQFIVGCCLYNYTSCIRPIWAFFLGQWKHTWWILITTWFCCSCLAVTLGQA